MNNGADVEKRRVLSYFAGKITKHKYLNRWTILLWDLFWVSAVSFVTFWLIGYIVDSYQFVKFGYRVAGITLGASLIAFLIVGTHNGILRYTSSKEILKICYAVILKSAIELPVLILLKDKLGFGSNVTAAKLFCAEIFNFSLTLSAMLLFRLFMVFIYNYSLGLQGAKGIGDRVLVFGSDEDSVSTIHYLENSKNFIYRIMGFVEFSDKIKHHKIFDKKVYYVKDKDYLRRVVAKHKIKGVIFPSKKSVLSHNKTVLPFILEMGLKIYAMPDTDEIKKSQEAQGALQMPVKQINIEDLLGRKEIDVDMEQIAGFLAGKSVLVTGAAGSIGSKLCKVISEFDIKHLMMIDNAETPMHDLKTELCKLPVAERFSFAICDVRDRERLEKIIKDAAPDIIYHAAAYKHVPMMEDNPTEAIAVNVQGTVNVATLALKYGVDKMVMVSTDKAVNPTNVMGASKRIAEIYTQSLSRAVLGGEVAGKTKFITTRFGNVLGSNGSVIPMFEKQIFEMGPVTVTHKDIVRYFMSIREACCLVLEASAFGEGYEIFIFDMGEPVKIAELAKNMIRLAGYTPDVDIKIEYTGLRPGEKLFEELLNNKENTLPTQNKKIFLAKVREFPYQSVKEDVATLINLAAKIDVIGAVKKMKEIVPEYRSKNSIFEKLD